MALFESDITDCIIFNLLQDKMIALVSRLLTSKAGVMVEKDDIAHIEFKSVSSSEAHSAFNKSIFVR